MSVPKPPYMEAHRPDGRPLDPQVKAALERLVNPMSAEVWERIWSQWRDLALYGNRQEPSP